MAYHMVIHLCDSNGSKKQENAIKTHTKGDLNVNVSVCTVFFFKDAFASMKGNNKFILKSKSSYSKNLGRWTIFFSFQWPKNFLYMLIEFGLSCFINNSANLIKV